MNVKKIIKDAESVIRAQGNKIRNGAGVTSHDIEAYSGLVNAYEKLLPVDELVKSQKRLEAIIGKAANVNPNFV